MPQLPFVVSFEISIRPRAEATIRSSARHAVNGSPPVIAIDGSPIDSN
ncbi:MULTISPECIES: hypothetical protein [unclassified Streptomyces]|nr:hypothetical protein [Streptomyces sp. NBC_00223]